MNVRCISISASFGVAITDQTNNTRDRKVCTPTRPTIWATNPQKLVYKQLLSVISLYPPDHLVESAWRAQSVGIPTFSRTRVCMSGCLCTHSPAPDRTKYDVDRKNTHSPQAYLKTVVFFEKRKNRICKQCKFWNAETYFFRFILTFNIFQFEKSFFFYKVNLNVKIERKCI